MLIIPVITAFDLTKNTRDISNRLLKQTTLRRSKLALATLQEYLTCFKLNNHIDVCLLTIEYNISLFITVE